jgi:hypothetical protein
VLRAGRPGVHPGMKLLTLAAAAAAALALTACGQAAASAPAPTTAAAAARPAPAPQTCKQKADAWKAANAQALASFKAALAPFSSGTVTSAQAHALSATAQAAEDVPPPACADPKGYYGQALAQLVTAGSAAEGGGVLSELGALTPMENAEADISQLDAELTGTIGESKL